jgi:DNA invertase Pin-like site-specific DNA recombinase
MAHLTLAGAAQHDRYCLYARKSSEDDERQALSIDSQIKAMLEVAKREGLEVTEIRRESHSAKASGARPVYAQLLEDIRLGNFNAILTWAPDRLSRNAGDLGTLVDLMDQGLLKEIRTHGQRFSNNPNEKFLLMILCSQAKLENDNRGINTKRGMKSRAELGYRPCKPPLGYLTMRAPGASKSHLVIDPVRAPFIPQMFEKVVEEGASGRKLHFWMQDVGFRTRAGKIIPLCMVYKILHNEFYTGYFEYPVGSGQRFKGDYEPLITKKMFDDVQRILAEAPKKPWGVKDFAFVKLMTCGNCGSGISDEEKHKHLKDGSVKRYVYYRCTQARDRNCKVGSIREDRLIESLAEIIDKVNLDASSIKKRIQAEYEHLQRFSTGVLGMAEERVLPKVDMKKYALFVLRNGRQEEKRELLDCIKSRLLLKDGVVSCPGSKSEM